MRGLCYRMTNKPTTYMHVSTSQTKIRTRVGNMNEWMNVWTVERMNGWMYGWMDVYMNRWMDGWMDGWMNGWTDECMDGWTHTWIDGWMDGLGWMDGWTDEGQTDERTNKWMNVAGLREAMEGRMDKSVNQ